MNVPIIDPLQGDFPEVVEEYLQHGNMKCIAFNRRGTLLAAGCADGSCVIWDFETRGIAKELHDNDCVASITSICWSKYGHYILASATDKSLTLWDVVSGEKVARVTLQQPSMHVRLHPGSCTPSICLACPLSSPPILVNLNTGSSSILPVFVTDAGTVTVPHQRNKCVDSSQPLIPTAATFNKSGDLLYIGNSKGEILVVDSETVRVYAVVPVSGGSVIKNVVFSGNGKNLLTNSNDRVIRIYDNLLPEKDASRHLDAISSSMNELNGVEKLKAVGSKCLQLFHEFSDAITKIHWKATCFSGDGEWVVGASASKGEHKIYIWDRAGHLAKILEGPKEALTDLCWHPIRPLVASVSVSGWVYIWAKDYTENWSAFAPDFKELEENEEYVEREDEFDILPEAEKVKDASINQDEEADIMTVENDSAFSDFDAEKELCFLPAVPSPDVPELQDRYPGSSLLKDGSPSRSPFSVEGLNGSASNPLEVVGNSAAENKVASKNLKRKRKLSVNGFGLQVNKGPKPSMKVKPSRKTTKSKHKPGDSNGSQIEVDLTDDYS